MDFRQPPHDGTYTYQRSGEATGILTFSEPAGTLPKDINRITNGATAMALELAFQDSRSGSMPTPDGRGLIRFYFTDEHPAPNSPLATRPCAGP